jgi:hypothetical protein
VTLGAWAKRLKVDFLPTGYILLRLSVFDITHSRRNLRLEKLLGQGYGSLGG